MGLLLTEAALPLSPPFRGAPTLVLLLLLKKGKGFFPIFHCIIRHCHPERPDTMPYNLGRKTVKTDPFLISISIERRRRWRGIGSGISLMEIHFEKMKKKKEKTANKKIRYRERKRLVVSMCYPAYVSLLCIHSRGMLQQLAIPAGE